MLIDVTERLIVRELEMDDADRFQDIVESCASGIAADLVHLSPEEFASRLEAYIKYQYGFYGYGLWGIFLKCEDCTYESYSKESEGKLIGLVGIVNGSVSKVGELSYAVLPEFRRKGYAYEACISALEYGRECGFTSFEATISKTNPASLNLADKLKINIHLQ